MSHAPDLDAVELISVRLAADGASLRLHVRGRDGTAHTLALPVRWLDDLLRAIPHASADGDAHKLASWTMDPTSAGEILLTLRTPEGHAVSFTMKPWQAQGMATLATHGHFEARQRRSLH